MKTNKAKLLPLLEEESQPLESLPSNAAWIVDGMALLHALQGKPSTFAQLARLVLQLAMSRSHTKGGRVGVVFDCYIGMCQSSQTKDSSVRPRVAFYQSSLAGIKCPQQLPKFLRQNENKSNLTIFLSMEWRNDE